MTKVKICGLSTPEAVQTAVEAGADYIGFVFAPSKRQVTLEQARELATGIPKGVQKVGVFVSPQREEVEQACQVVGLDLIQVHGSMDETILQEFPQQTIRAVQVGKDATLPETSANYLAMDVLENCDLPLPALQSSLTGLRKEYPVISAAGVREADGTLTTVKECGEAFNDYRSLEYYLLFDYER